MSTTNSLSPCYQRGGDKLLCVVCTIPLPSCMLLSSLWYFSVSCTILWHINLVGKKNALCSFLHAWMVKINKGLTYPKLLVTAESVEEDVYLLPSDWGSECRILESGLYKLCPQNAPQAFQEGMFSIQCEHKGVDSKLFLRKLPVKSICVVW